MVVIRTVSLKEEDIKFLEKKYKKTGFSLSTILRERIKELRKEQGDD